MHPKQKFKVEVILDSNISLEACESSWVNDKCRWKSMLVRHRKMCKLYHYDRFAFFFQSWCITIAEDSYIGSVEMTTLKRIRTQLINQIWSIRYLSCAEYLYLATKAFLMGERKSILVFPRRSSGVSTMQTRDLHQVKRDDRNLSKLHQQACRPCSQCSGRLR